jgi:hypothetical protein
LRAFFAVVVVLSMPTSSNCLSATGKNYFLLVFLCDCLQSDDHMPNKNKAESAAYFRERNRRLVQLYAPTLEDKLDAEAIAEGHRMPLAIFMSHYVWPEVRKILNTHALSLGIKMKGGRKG